jgi:hypothetical protein
MSSVFRLSLFSVALLAGLTSTHAADRTWWESLETRNLTGAPLPATGRWIVLIFLSPECPVANASVPTLNALAGEFAGRDFSFVGVYSDPTIDLATLQSSVAEVQLRFPVADDRSQRLARTVAAVYTPEAFVFSRDGKLLYRGRIDDRVTDFGSSRPAATKQDLRNVLRALAAGESGPFATQPGFGCAISSSVQR